MALVRMKDIIARVNGFNWGGEMVRLCYSSMAGVAIKSDNSGAT